MNKILITTLTAIMLLLVSATSNAQLLPVSLGIKGGVNFSKANDEPAKIRTGYNVGLTADVNLPANFAIMSGLEVTSKGTKFKRADVSVNATYLQLPVHIGYKFGIIPGVRLHASVGPYFAQGIGGKVKGKDNLLGHDVKTFDYMDKFDWGLGVGVGVTLLNKIQVRAGYDLGMKNVASGMKSKDLEENGNAKFKNRNAYISVGFIFF